MIDVGKEFFDVAFENPARFSIIFTDFVKIAEGYGVKGIKVTKKKDVIKALKEAIKTSGPVLVDFHIENEENVFPMVAPGHAINKIMGGLA